MNPFTVTLISHSILFVWAAYDETDKSQHACKWMDGQLFKVFRWWTAKRERERERESGYLKHTRASWCKWFHWIALNKHKCYVQGTVSITQVDSSHNLTLFARSQPPATQINLQWGARKEALPEAAAEAKRERVSLHPDWNVKAEMDVKDAHSSSLIE